MNWLSRVEKLANDDAIENALVVIKSDSVLFGRKGAKSIRTKAIMMLMSPSVDQTDSLLKTSAQLKENIVRIGFSRDSDDADQMFSGLYAAEPLVRVNAIKEGLPALLPSMFAQRMGISKELMYGTIGLPRATVERKVKDDEVLSPEESARVLGIARLIGQVQTMVGDREDFDAPTWVANWLESYLPALQCKPAKLMDTTEGQALVSNLLARAESGAYS